MSHFKGRLSQDAKDGLLFFAKDKQPFLVIVPRRDSVLASVACRASPACRCLAAQSIPCFHPSGMIELYLLRKRKFQEHIFFAYGGVNTIFSHMPTTGLHLFPRYIKPLIPWALVAERGG